MHHSFETPLFRRTAVLSDLIALAGAFHMAVKEVVPRLQTKAVVPWSPSLDINLYNEIPNLLSVIREPDDARELAEIPVTQPLSIKADIVKRKLRAQDMMIMDAIRGIEQAAQKWSPPLSQLTNSVSSRLTPFQIQKQTEAVQNVIAAIHSGTNREQY
ncbi:hypothetical protein GNI_099790 [Gregarina niphandrodes]|uniref:Uncharacterized protein n=1 Tax=Gregarina niphandrodes TaxID=110365 RepID=A0A023B4L4_GRENI|nr:hypothetical protein GNI_099790 [Gregarina niphandrodes]EZG57003.1 hypothetical protein GNI_099790 [Gregarina niphandrodes]|eukprot:XP_011131115.1 hypothetical protein GNI_099790 [Gregarina niphandrodes]